MYIYICMEIRFPYSLLPLVGLWKNAKFLGPAQALVAGGKRGTRRMQKETGLGVPVGRRQMSLAPGDWQRYDAMKPALRSVCSSLHLDGFTPYHASDRVSTTTFMIGLAAWWVPWVKSISSAHKCVWHGICLETTSACAGTKQKFLVAAAQNF